MRKSIQVLLLCVIPWTPPLSVAAQSPGGSARVDAALDHFWNARFPQATSALEQILAAPDLNRQEAVEAHRYLVALKDLADDPQGARQHARAAAAFDPEVTAPQGSSAEAERLVRGAVEAQGGEPAQLEFEPHGPIQMGEPVSIRVGLSNAPDGFLHELSLGCEGGDADPRQATGPTSGVQITYQEVRTAIECHAAGLGTSGAELLFADESFDVMEASMLDGTRGTDSSVDSTSGTPWGLVIGGGVGAVVLGVAIVLLVTSSSSDDASLGAPMPVFASVGM